MAQRQRFPFTDQQVSELRRRWSIGETLAMIAAAMGVTKGVISGKVNLYELARRDGSDHPRKDSYKYGSKVRKVALEKAHHAVEIPALPPTPDPVATPVEARPIAATGAADNLPSLATFVAPIRVASVQRERPGCQFPVTDRRPWKFCGAETLLGSPWCFKCRKRVYSRHGGQAA